MEYFVYSLLSPEEVEKILSEIRVMEWGVGKTLNPEMQKKVKFNLELQSRDEKGNPTPATEILNSLHRKIGNIPGIKRDILARVVYPPKFNQYKEGNSYGLHVDAPLMEVAFNNDLVDVRTDYACTAFLTDDYEGGELVVDGTKIKGKAGTCIIYPADSIHEVLPVTKGERICAITWIESLIRDKGNRGILRDIGLVMLDLEHFSPEHRLLGGVHARLTRKWSA